MKREKLPLNPFDPESYFFGLDRYFQSDFFPLEPDIKIFEQKDALQIQINMPGLEKEQVKVTYENGMLEITGKHQEQLEQRGKNHLIHEERTAFFTKQIPLGPNLNAKQIQVKQNPHGVNLYIPKK